MFLLIKEGVLPSMVMSSIPSEAFFENDKDAASLRQVLPNTEGLPAWYNARTI